jgi:hypothetical protein
VKQPQTTPNQARDAGLALLLILLVVMYFTGTLALVVPGIVVLVLIMIWPAVFRPFATLWFGLSRVFGTIASRIILSLLFFLVVTPVGIIRQMLGKDTMRLKDWKNGQDSVLWVRNHTYSKKDIDRPY